MSSATDKQNFRGFFVTDAKNWSSFKEQEVPELKPFGEYDIDIKSECCGVCSSDVHTISSGWGEAPLPVCAGHEVVGVVERVGSKVSEFKVGDRAGVGAQVWACGVCKACKSSRGDENYCPHKVDTYGAPYPTEQEAAKFGVNNGKALGLDGSKAQGGYSNRIRAHEQFVFPIPEGLDSAEAVSLLLWKSHKSNSRPRSCAPDLPCSARSFALELARTIAKRLPFVVSAVLVITQCNSPKHLALR
jgi:alcohol dehydrogenase (NADP+)